MCSWSKNSYTVLIKLNSKSPMIPVSCCGHAGILCDICCMILFLIFYDDSLRVNTPICVEYFRGHVTGVCMTWFTCLTPTSSGTQGYLERKDDHWYNMITVSSGSICDNSHLNDSFSKITDYVNAITSKENSATQIKH